MWNVLIIARREVKRFRSRFSGGSRGIVLFILLAALLASYFVAQGGFSLSKDFYTIGVSPGGPKVDDSRFNVVTLDPATGYQELSDGTIDLYLYGDQVVARDDTRSQYAEGALKQYLDGIEETRIRGDYNIDQAFPLRVQVYNLTVNSSAATTDRSVAGLIGPTPGPESEPSAPVSTPRPGQVSASTPVPTSAATDAAVLQQLNSSSGGFNAGMTSDGQVIIPSLYNPPVPLPQVILAFLYIVPMFFISVFFTSSFMDEKTNRKLNILMSTPVSAFDIILGKMLPYLAFSLVVITAVTLYLGGNLLLAIVIFAPVTLFIFAIYLLVALFYRTYKDQTFFSMTAITFVTGYLVFPALFAGTNNLSYISPLTLAVEMYQGTAFGTTEWLGYALSAGPLYLFFIIAMYVSVRIFNEEYLMSFGPLYQKTGDAIYLSISKKHPYLSVAALSLVLIPAVFIIELIILALVMVIPKFDTFWIDLPFLKIPISWYMVITIVLLFFCALVEEIAKSAGIATLIENGKVASYRQILALSFVSALAFWLGEKLMLVFSIALMPSANIIDTMNSSFGGAVSSPLMLVALLLLPLAAHFVFTSVTCLGTRKLGTKYYLFMLLCATLIHVLYNVYNLRVMGAF